ncbi:replication-associated recombination protein A [candidate division WWE3 bacterium]|uniref:Replication-associated recombination protein A n=1 Tax=candidate division WWE3 bacterium TaxID=2053526 RepID=A0A955RX30_UNCKA|nr:replication-associated recombination protein A [candidate division WWE3 bacterium]
MNTAHVPLADRMRPRSLDEFYGQSHLVGEGAVLQKAIKQDVIPSMIFWGPPGSGKTTLARIIASQTNSEFIQLSATMHGVKELRETFDEAIRNRDGLYARNSILFIDEIHRFNKAQQDALLPHVENGTIILIGATTENPSFEVNSAILSRTRVFVLQRLDAEDIQKILEHTLEDKDRGLGMVDINIDEETLLFLSEIANGDARTALNTLELTLQFVQKSENEITTISKDSIRDALQQTNLHYDAHGEEHYNTISAYIKSMRASDADAALYYLARMIESGEDPLFIARRMVVFASEDIGLAQPTALVVANEVFRACETIGYPECQINLAHGTAYLSNCLKDRSAYDAYFEALSDVKSKGNIPIPLHLRNAPTRLMKELEYGKDYEMYPENASYLPDILNGKKYLTK